ncbi:MAG: CAP domain-containing protein [Pseudomonadaceae bacterium]
MTEFEEDVLVIVNEARAAGATCGGQTFGATGPLTMNPALRCAARVHSKDMADRGFFDHTNPDGEDPFVRMERAGYSYFTAGENIAAGQSSPAQVMQGWMDSPGHCSNIMNPDFAEIGVGTFEAEDGAYRYLWTQAFGAS